MSDPDDLTDTILWLRARGANIHQQGCTVGGILMPVNTSAAAAPYLASADGKRDIDEKKT